jgi:Ca-activated chloride channel homolog
MRLHRRYFLTALLLAGSLLAGVAPRAQDAQQPDRVNLNVLVLGDKNRPVGGLSREDFQVFEGGAPQTVSFFLNENVPVSYGLLVDSSGSLKTQYKAVLGAAALIIDRSLPGDEGFLVRFVGASKIEMAQNFTPEKAQLLNALTTFEVEGGQTALIDALYVSAEHIAKYKREEDDARRRRALILVTDGEERASNNSQDDLGKLLRGLNVQVFVIGLVEKLDEEGSFIRRSPRERSRALLEWLAAETGGRAFFPKTFDEMGEAAEEIARDLHSQYVIGYTPAGGKAGQKAYRKVRVKLAPGSGREKLKVITRSGYTAEAPRP